MEYDLRESVPDPETDVSLREAADMSPRSLEAARRGLPDTLHGVSMVETATNETLGMARIVDDSSTVCHICDMVVRPDTVGCNCVEIFATPGGEIVHGLTADSMTNRCRAGTPAALSPARRIDPLFP